MKRREMLSAACGIVVVASMPARSQSKGNWLVSPEDFMREREALARAGLSWEDAMEREKNLVPKATPGAPQIVVRSPSVSEAIELPVIIRVDFIAADGASIIPGSLKVKYGFIGLDVTSRILAHAEVDESSLRANVEEMPSGKHSFEISISDSVQRTGRQKLRCEIAK